MWAEMFVILASLLGTIFPHVVSAPSGFQRMRKKENLAVAVDEGKLRPTCVKGEFKI